MRNITTYESGVVTGERVVALAGPREPWTSEIEKRLRAKGYTVKRFVSVAEVSTQVATGVVETRTQASARVVLNVSGYAENTAMTRCFGGGYKFLTISAEVIDLESNETLSTYSNSGYSEDCPPLAGTIFGDIVGLVDDAFK